ncbi:MAG: hypothetical protein CRN43_10145 [Candidatus Nephrothrix sp. EaCA]|nr:MAG: hypothetical protein CRN43_10145 [Candidatus Nephrothrix sp. EaCA]
MNPFLSELIRSKHVYRIPPKAAVALDVAWKKLTDEEIELLKKILNALSLSLNGVQVIAAEEIPLLQNKPSRLIIFKDAEEPYKPSVVNEIPCVYSHSLTQLLANADLRKQLWGALKKLFEIRVNE